MTPRALLLLASMVLPVSGAAVQPAPAQAPAYAARQDQLDRIER